MIGSLGVDKKTKLKTFKHIFIFIIFFECMGIFWNGPFQKIGYIYYKLNNNKYSVFMADVVDSKTDAFEIAGFSLVPTSHTLVEYTVDNVLHSEWTMFYSDIYKGETIMIAVHNNDYSKIIRAIPYEITEGDKQIYLKQITIILILSFCIAVVYIIEKNIKDDEALLS